MDGSSVGTLGVIVSPPYIGLGHMPDQRLAGEQRARIRYREECVAHGQVWGKCACGDSQRRYVGYARLWVPKGTYNLFLFFAAPSETLPVAFKPLPHPHIQVADGMVPVDPIIHEDPLANLLDGIVR